MSWDSAFGQLKQELPRFNNYLLKEHAKEQINQCADFIGEVFKQAASMMEGNVLRYVAYKYLTPVETLEACVKDEYVSGKWDIQKSEWCLVDYQFIFEGRDHHARLYMPHMHENAVQIFDTKNYPQTAITERTICRITDGVIVKVLRSPIHFWRNLQISYTSTSGFSSCDAVITVNAFYRKSNSKTKYKIPLVLYLFAKYPYEEVLRRMSLSPSDFSFTNVDDPDDPEYLYYKVSDDIYIKVRASLVKTDEDNVTRRFVVSVYYILKNEKSRFTIGMLCDPEGMFYKRILGKTLFPNAKNNAALAANHADNHLSSLDTYLDAYTRNELMNLKDPIYCNTIYELFEAVLANIDTWLTFYVPNDLFAKRVSGVELFTSEIIQVIFNKFYKSMRMHKIPNQKSIENLLRFSAIATKDISKVKALQGSKALYNDNDLISIFIKKIRQSSTGNGGSSKHAQIITDKEHQFDPSFVAIESPLAIPSSNPGIAGDVNPFAVIDRSGYFVQEKMPWYAAIAGLSKYLN